MHALIVPDQPQTVGIHATTMVFLLASILQPPKNCGFPQQKHQKPTCSFIHHANLSGSRRHHVARAGRAGRTGPQQASRLQTKQTPQEPVDGIHFSISHHLISHGGNHCVLVCTGHTSFQGFLRCRFFSISHQAMVETTFVRNQGAGWCSIFVLEYAGVDQKVRT